MNFSPFIRKICGGEQGSSELAPEEAAILFAAMLDGGVPELELGALVVALRMKSLTLPEFLGCYQALEQRVYKLDGPTDDIRPVLLPSYSGTRDQPNLTPLLALLLVRFGVSVLVHGTLESAGGGASAYILRELGVMPCASLAQAQTALRETKLAFVPMHVLCPGLAGLLSLHSRLGVKNLAHQLARLIDPFGGQGFRIVGVDSRRSAALASDFFLATGATGLVLSATEGEPFAHPLYRPQLDYFRDGEVTTLFAAEADSLKFANNLPAALDIAETAGWIKKALTGEVPLPFPLVNQLACCLYGSGYTQDINQAKAIAAMQNGNLVAA
jgi:anthranilate phosphoribosyltransferase